MANVFIQVSAWAGLIIGPTATAVCFFATYVKGLRAYLEEPLDIFIIHGLGGLWGMLMTGIFTEYAKSLPIMSPAKNIYSKAVAALDGSIIPGGALNKNGWQIL
jgi:ammonia channel protein AmtB